jgi:hypothetical protein
MAKTLQVQDPAGLISVYGFDIGGAAGELAETTIKEIVLAESLTTPGLQTSVTLQSFIYTTFNKNFDNFKNKPVTFNLVRENTGKSLQVAQQVYRLANRDFMPTNVGQTEEMTVHACDQTLLNDAKTLVSKSWKCTKPSDIVSYVLGSCVGARQTDVEQADPTRDYIAENIHPFQVIAQQSNVALAQGDDPSFVHYMTYRNLGTHHFRSLKSLTQAGAGFQFQHAETGWVNNGGYANPRAVISFMFPCDFDYLSDLLNGIDENGSNQNALAVFNPVAKAMSLLGNQTKGCGMGGFNYKQALTNGGTSKQQDSCNFGVEKYLLKRQARMSLLERDKIGLRIVVPWNPDIHAGDMINLTWDNKNSGGLVYGSGDYLVVSMQHSVRLGGFSTTTMDCVSRTVGNGGVL